MILTTVLLLAILLIAVYIALRPKDVVVEREAVFYGNGYDYSVPPTWNYDWSGGPGRDRHRIMRERGPYNSRGR
jgi:hypothetical protein